MNPMSRQELANSATNYAAGLMRDGYSNQEIIAALLEEGLKQEDAVGIVRQLLRLRADDIRQQAKIHLIKGFGYMIAAGLVGMFVDSFLLNGIGGFIALFGFILGLGELNRSKFRNKQAESLEFPITNPSD